MWLQKSIPAALAEGLRVEALYERIPELVDELRGARPTRSSTDASDVLDRFYRERGARPASRRFSRRGPTSSTCARGRERALEPFRRIGAFVDAEEKEKVDDLSSLYTEKLELDAQLQPAGRPAALAVAPRAAGRACSWASS